MLSTCALRHMIKATSRGSQSKYVAMQGVDLWKLFCTKWANCVARYAPLVDLYDAEKGKELREVDPKKVSVAMATVLPTMRAFLEEHEDETPEEKQHNVNVLLNLAKTQTKLPVKQMYDEAEEELQTLAMRYARFFLHWVDEVRAQNE